MCLPLAVRLVRNREKHEERKRYEVASRVGSREQFWHKISKVRHEPCGSRLPTCAVGPHAPARRFRYLLPFTNNCESEQNSVC